MTRLLLHICCAPCSASAADVLKNNFDVSFYWFNPNIYDQKEYEIRKENAKRFAKELGVNFYEEDGFIYDGKKWKQESSLICENCYKLRLEKTAKFAKDNNFDAFSTSLLSSPYQKHELIKQISQKLSLEYKIDFVYKDFRPKFYEGKNSLRAKGYYLQKYCGCEKSFQEMLERKNNK
ncbi:epoxyqueuosine reductase QueH [Endomicrobium proavitum]|uniref:Epoxyqueuosine reductase QueH n=1 Tax=Endomicrobium proavitum TaxID=1408281 RepID=A0A0G3WKB1_9BACT|nr:epoxyqueuosine reductase QueH [Endomicrobium proavitum]AKL97934.1 conserved exported protein of unknown function [Endomicrobium proavitum]